MLESSLPVQITTSNISNHHTSRPTADHSAQTLTTAYWVVIFFIIKAIVDSSSLVRPPVVEVTPNGEWRPEIAFSAISSCIVTGICNQYRKTFGSSCLW